jgi:hypothetical protein
MFRDAESVLVITPHDSRFGGLRILLPAKTQSD